MIENKVFEKTDYTVNGLPRGEYENCRFINCVFYNSDISNIIFRDCEFNNCDFSLAKTKNTGFSNIKFLNCKLLGLHFNTCNNFLLSVSFDNCLLKLSSFYKLKLKQTSFKNCNLHEADFTEADITRSTFDNCDLHTAIFSNTILEMVDFRTAYNYSIDPESNKIKKAKFSKAGAIGLLDKYNIEIE